VSRNSSSSSARFAEEVAAHIDMDQLTGDLHTDGELGATEFEPATALALREGGPWGAGFPEPIFDGRFDVVEAKVVADRHLKLRVRVPSGPTLDAIVFRHFDARAPLAVQSGDSVELVYRMGHRRISRRAPAAAHDGVDRPVR
jgi:single-stranded-DNA-specific exonuclease